MCRPAEVVMGWMDTQRFMHNWDTLAKKEYFLENLYFKKMETVIKKSEQKLKEGEKLLKNIKNVHKIFSLN